MSTYKEEIEIVEGSVGEVVNLQAQKKDTEEGYDLTGCIVKWVIFESEDSIAVILNGTCVEVDLGVGKVKYTTTANDWGKEKLHYKGEREEDKYESSLVADRADPLFHKEFQNLKVKISKKAPT